MKRKVLLILLCGVCLLGLTACGTNNSVNKYSSGIEEIRNGTDKQLGENTMGEYFDYILKNAKWSEDDSFKGELGTGAVIVKGQEKKTGKTMEVLFIKNVTKSNAITNIEYLKVDDEKKSYVNYLYDYKSEVSKYYAKNEK